MKPVTLDAAELGDTFIDFRKMTPIEQWRRIQSMIEENGYMIIKSFAPKCPHCKSERPMIYINANEPFTNDHWQCQYCDSTLPL